MQLPVLGYPIDLLIIIILIEIIIYLAVRIISLFRTRTVTVTRETKNEEGEPVTETSESSGVTPGDPEGRED